MTSDNHVQPETLAAWAEGRLAVSEAATVEAHMASCPLCQDMLGVFARTVPETRPEPSAVPGFSWFRWRWAVPVAAAATAAAIWVAIPERTDRDEFERTVAPAIEETAAPRAAESSADAAAPAEETPRLESRRDAPALADRAEKQAPQANERDQDKKLEARDREAPQAAAPQSAAAPEQSRLSTETALLRAAANEVVSPDPLVRWRVVPPGRLERSSNGGKTWESVALPEAVNPVSVRAPAATTAIVTAADGRQFRTDDQGKTWNLVQP